MRYLLLKDVHKGINFRMCSNYDKDHMFLLFIFVIDKDEQRLTLSNGY